MPAEAPAAMLRAMQVLPRLCESSQPTESSVPGQPRPQRPSPAQVLDNFKRATALFFKRRLPEPRPAPAPGGDAGPWVSSCTLQAWEQALGKKPLSRVRRPE